MTTDANGRNARFWADHFREVDDANRDALGAHHKPGHSVAELITAVVGELAEAREFGNEAMSSAYAKTQEIAKWVEGYGKLSADNKRLTRERDEAHEHLDKVRQALRTPEGWATKMHALRVRQQRDKARDLLGAIWPHVGWRSVTRHLTTEQRELWADAVEVAGAPGSTIAADRWWRDDAPVSGSDTTEGYVSAEKKWPWFDGFHEAETKLHLPPSGTVVGPMDPGDVIECPDTTEDGADRG